jgi:putative FmdB family regulatory protein
MCAVPIYEFQCNACGHRFDRLQKLSDADPTDCPNCGAPQVQRLLSAPQFRLSGGGWYETDFKKDSDKKRNLAGDGAAAKASESAPAPTKTDAKPAASSSSE